MGTDKRARKKANRAAKTQAEMEAAKRRRRNRTIIRVSVLLAISIGLFALLSWARNDDPDTTTTTSTTAAPAEAWARFAALPAACDGTAPTEPPTDLSFGAPDDLDLTGPVTAELVTTCGTITLELDPSASPESANSFVFLAEAGFYDRQAFHRLAPGFVVQGGDPTATGTGGAGYTVVDEFPEVGTAYPRGTVALARTPAPNASGSQFFIVLTDAGASHLGSSAALLYNVLGTVVDGFETLDAIAAIPAVGDAPTEGVFIESITITR